MTLRELRHIKNCQSMASAVRFWGASGLVGPDAGEGFLIIGDMSRAARATSRPAPFKHRRCHVTLSWNGQLPGAPRGAVCRDGRCL